MTNTELTPAQKGAITRANNKAAKEAAAVEVVAATEIAPTIAPVVQEVIDEVDNFATSEYFQVTASKVTPKFNAKTREVIYNIGIYLGALATIAPVVAGVLQGDAQLFAGSIGGLALSLTNLLAKLNISKTADDLADAVG